jgi:hypothetical protein
MAFELILFMVMTRVEFPVFCAVCEADDAPEAAGFEQPVTITEIKRSPPRRAQIAEIRLREICTLRSALRILLPLFFI